MQPEIKKLLSAILDQSFKFEDSIYALATHACKDMSPHQVAWIMKEHDKVRGIVKRLETTF